MYWPGGVIRQEPEERTHQYPVEQPAQAAQSQHSESKKRGRVSDMGLDRLLYLSRRRGPWCPCICPQGRTSQGWLRPSNSSLTTKGSARSKQASMNRDMHERTLMATPTTAAVAVRTSLSQQSSRRRQCEGTIAILRAPYPGGAAQLHGRHRATMRRPHRSRV